MTWSVLRVVAVCAIVSVSVSTTCAEVASFTGLGYGTQWPLDAPIIYDSTNGPEVVPSLNLSFNFFIDHLGYVPPIISVEGEEEIDLSTSEGVVERANVHGISVDGSVVVGERYISTRGSDAFRWTENDGVVSLGAGAALGVSADGVAVVGYGGPGGEEPFRWTEEAGLELLGFLPGGFWDSAALAASTNGHIVVGYSRVDQDAKAFMWSAANGMLSLQDILTNELGLDLSGWQLTGASGISADGLTIVGAGINPDGNGEYWIATLPEPGTLVVLGLGIPLLLRR